MNDLAPERETLDGLRARALELHRAGDRAAARPLYARYLAAAPRDALMWSNLGALLRSDKAFDLALVAQRRAYALAPDRISVTNNLANVLADTGHMEEALRLRRVVLAERPDDAMVWAMVGKTLRAMGRVEESLTHLAQGQERHPGHTEIAIQRAMSLLAAGNYAEGFRAFDVRWQTDELTPRDIARPKWEGGSLAGKRIAVLPEQGFGDGIAFARFLPALRRFGPAEVILAVERPVARLYQGVPGADRVVTGIPPAEAFDVWTNVMDLPVHHFDTEAEPPRPTRLAVPADSRARAEALLAPHGATFNVGVVWTGSLTYRANAFRSFGHAEFHRLLDIPDMQMFSLYKGPALADFTADGSDLVIVDAGSRDRDFGDCAAMMQALDLVITSDTATAHLAGSLGVPVWTLLHWDAFWLWRHEGAQTPWYPSMRLIRQKTPRDWAQVFGQVHARLSREVERWREGRA